MNAIQVETLSKRYGDVLAVDSISFAAPIETAGSSEHELMELVREAIAARLEVH